MLNNQFTAVHWFYLEKISSILLTTSLLTYVGAVLKSTDNVAGPMSKIGPNWSYIPHGTESERVVGPIPKIGPNWSYDPLGTGSNL